MSEDQERELQEGLAAIAGVMKLLAGFTAQAELNGYSRNEAVTLTGVYLTALLAKGNA
jgi:hypothetical protein